MKHTLILLFASALLHPQVSGIVIDAETTQPLASVNITSKENGTATDENGRFFLDVPVGEQLTISHIGYSKIMIFAEMEMIIELKPLVIKSNEIIVQGGLRQEALQRSTSSVTVFDKEKIRRTDGNHFQDIMETIPNLNAAGGTSRPRYFQIRGIGERSHYFAEGPPNFSVGFVIDDIDLSGLGMAGLLYDLEQVEVFKGPQSAMYGPNALAGLISLSSANPTHRFQSSFKYSNGTDNLIRNNFMLNIPLGKMLALRVAWGDDTSDGFRTNTFLDKTNTNGRKENYIREKLLFQPNENFQTILTAFRAVLDNKYDAWAPDNNTDLITYTNQQGEDSQETNAYSFRANYTKGKMNAAFILSNSNTDLIHSYDGDWGNDDYWLQEPYYFDPNVTYWKYEFFDSTARTRSNQTIEGRMNYGDVVVGYYTKSLEETDNAVGWLYGGDAALAKSTFSFNVSAIYGQIDKHITNRLKILTNVRKESNEISYVGTASYFDWYMYDLAPLDTVSFDIDHELFGGKLALQYLIDDQMNVFGSISRGYKASGVNQHPLLSEENRRFDPEYMINYEIGLRRFTKKYSFHLSAFIANRLDQQVSISSQQQEGDPNSFIFYTANATTGSLSGLELDGVYKLNSYLSFSGSLGLLNTRVDAFTFESDSGVVSTLGGREAAHAPKYSFSFTVDYENDKGFFGKLELTGKDKFYFSDSHDEISDPYQLLNGHIGYGFGPFKIKLWGRNILDTRYATRGFYFGLEPIWNEDLQDHEYPDRKYISFGDPAHFGIMIDYYFN
ncbi:MAG: TonB-dependent receptor [Candidatus Marinimicrobia bacterium]|jgi:outer membrane receptor protein involved in Fe transport|nr:TonB-dependent receptor [Candidatus Neomarinimicrobiota bacterium]MDP6726358.1 TonB-dependent receptor [Candidatus Neomarinimicrobiota bacterium]|tara:strand:+ start:512 stop:2860 length:2349 start_codon:yes stop_codon:yes gene_type:complete